jgi:hypothetical protein
LVGLCGEEYVIVSLFLLCLPSTNTTSVCPQLTLLLLNRYDAENHMETYKSRAVVALSNGTTTINAAIAADGKLHRYPAHLERHIPETMPYDVALRCNPNGKVPQIQFTKYSHHGAGSGCAVSPDGDGIWLDFAPGSIALRGNYWFPYVQMCDGDLLTHLTIKKRMLVAAELTGGSE